MKKNYKEILLKIIISIIIVLFLIHSINILIKHQNDSIEAKTLYILNSFCLMLSIIWLPLIIYNADKRTKKKVIKENLSKIDFKKTKDYYRDILKNHTPLELSYIDNFEIDYTKDVIATILSLELKKKITIKDNYIDIIDKDISNLQKSEIYILNNIKDGKVTNLDSYEILSHAKEEAFNNNLIIKNKVKRKEEKSLTIEKLMILEDIGMFLLALLLIFYLEDIVDFLNNVVLPNIYIIAPIIIIICLLLIFISVQKFYRSVKAESYYQNKNNSYKRTVKGEEINYKIEGLKNYLKDFSLLSNKEQQELVLWEEYLIYSVIFNMNDKIINDLTKLITITKG